MFLSTWWDLSQCLQKATLIYSRWWTDSPGGMRSTTAKACADALALQWAAHTITTDKGAQFTSAVWKCMSSKLGVKNISTTTRGSTSVSTAHRIAAAVLR